MSHDVAGIIQLSSVLDLLKGSSKDFAQSLVSQYQTKGRLSDKQIACIPKLLDQATKAASPKEDSPSSQLQNFAKVIQIFDTAREKGYKKKIILRLGDKDYKVRLSEAPDYGVNKGMVYVKVNDEYRGKITREGKWIFTGSADETLQQKLNEFSQSPAETARKYGFKTNTCCVCGKILTNPESIKAGIGPICAENFGL